MFINLKSFKYKMNLLEAKLRGIKPLEIKTAGIGASAGNAVSQLLDHFWPSETTYDDDKSPDRISGSGKEWKITYADSIKIAPHD